MITQAHVDEALRYATEGGYSFEGWPASDIAIDMLAYDAFVDIVEEQPTEEQLIPLVVDWRNRNPKA